MSAYFRHAMPYGAQLRDEGRTRFRLWAPDADGVWLEIEGGSSRPMLALDDGWHEYIGEAPAGTRYRYRVASDLRVPDPASRLQDGGDVHGASVVVDPRAYAWQHPDWSGRPWHEAVIYELHVGAFGGFRSVRDALPRLHALGITAIELMPIAQFPGTRNWGYDGVLPYAPASAYGTPEELKALVDAAHGLGLMILLDVVYNHFGPDGNYLGEYASPFFREGPQTPWGAAIDVALPQVGDFFVHNALYWLQEYRFDGLRLDAVHAIGNPGWLSSLAARVRAAVGDRQVHLVLENEGNQSHLLGRRGFDAQWNDDFHNALHVLLTGEHAGYYAAYADDPLRHLVRCLGEGFAWQGEPMRGKPRGEPSRDLAPTRFVDFLQNHDQIGNRALGERLTVLVEPRRLEAVYALLLLTPPVPLLFMGEEWGSRTPFLFFTDHQNAALREAVREGRRREFAQFDSYRQGGTLPDPNDVSTFERSRPDPSEAASPQGIARLTLIRLLLGQRQRHLVPRLGQARPLGARALGPRALHARWQMGDAQLSVHCNLGDEPVPIDVTPTANAQWLHGDASAIAALATGRLAPVCTLVCLGPTAMSAPA